MAWLNTVEAVCHFAWPSQNAMFTPPLCRPFVQSDIFPADTVPQALLRKLDTPIEPYGECWQRDAAPGTYESMYPSDAGGGVPEFQVRSTTPDSLVVTN